MPGATAFEYLAKLESATAELGERLDQLLADEDCESYVKTIYIGYQIGSEMVAALYGHASHIELALALAEDDPSPGLKDASHLTWRSLPLLLEVRSKPDLEAAAELIKRACERVKSGIHDVHRDNDHFVRARAARQSHRAHLRRK